MILVLLGAAAAASAAPVTRDQLVSMARDKVDPGVMRAIVERDCVDFDVAADNAAELSRVVPAAVLEAAIACRRSDAARPALSPRAEIPATSGAPAAAPPAAAPPATAPASLASSAAAPSGTPAGARIRLRAVFIGESGALRCSASIDGVEAATFVKEEEGKFGEAVERTKIGRESGYLPVAPGRHRVIFRCDPKAQAVTVDVDVPAGESRTIEIGETTLRHWKLRRIRTP